MYVKIILYKINIVRKYREVCKIFDINFENKCNVEWDDLMSIWFGFIGV